MWSLHDGCKDIISDIWSTRIVGCPMFILSSKLKLLKNALKIWNKDIFGDVHIFVSNSEENLRVIQDQIQINGPTDSLRNAEKLAQIKLEEALHRQDWFWQEKAHVNWHVDGDRNTSYFQRIAKIKNTTKSIPSLKVGADTITGPRQISNHIVHYYKSLFCTNSHVLQDQLLIDDVIPEIIDDRLNSMLTMMPSAQEIKNAVFSLNKDGGPMALGPSFFMFTGILFTLMW
ncbi:hypothetical protein QL285_075894 [Trifolium repens]|nr:hypothetical protein QL285_075894 [Trifolium repens]